MSSEPIVTVVIPIRDRPDILARCLESVRSQSVADIEVLVVDNGSQNPELTAEVVESFCDERIRMLHLPDCKNANVARNRGMDEARGRYIAFLDSDDEWYVDHLKNAVSDLEASGTNFYFSSMDVDDGHAVFRRSARELARGEDPAEYLFGREAGFAPTPSFVIRRGAMTIPWDESLARHQDFDFFIRVCRQHQPIASTAPAGKINWKKGEPRSYDSESMIRFYRKHAAGFSASTRFRFAWGKIKLALRRRDPRLFLHFAAVLPVEMIRIVTGGASGR